MTQSKHPKAPVTDTDLTRNPGIGESKGEFARSDANPDMVRGDNTEEGDVLNDVKPTGGVNPEQRGRTNK
jgi:hypothetical protein